LTDTEPLPLPAVLPGRVRFVWWIYENSILCWNKANNVNIAFNSTNIERESITTYFKANALMSFLEKKTDNNFINHEIMPSLKPTLIPNKVNRQSIIIT
jgi:hypothetical protein